MQPWALLVRDNRETFGKTISPLILHRSTVTMGKNTYFMIKTVKLRVNDSFIMPECQWSY